MFQTLVVPSLTVIIVDNFASIAVIVAALHFCSCPLCISLGSRLDFIHSGLGQAIRSVKVVVVVVAA